MRRRASLEGSGPRAGAVCGAVLVLMMLQVEITCQEQAAGLVAVQIIIAISYKTLFRID